MSEDHAIAGAILIWVDSTATWGHIWSMALQLWEPGVAPINTEGSTDAQGLVSRQRARWCPRATLTWVAYAATRVIVTSRLSCCLLGDFCWLAEAEG